MKSCNNQTSPIDLSLPDRCCNGTTGCNFDGSLRNVKAESIYVQKVYDAALFNLQGLQEAMNVDLSPNLGQGARIVRVLDIRCKKFFDPEDVKNPKNFRVKSITKDISGGSFVKKGGHPIEVVGPDGKFSEKIIFADTQDCDEENRGTPIFGTQLVKISGKVRVEIDVIFVDDCDKKCKATLVGNVEIAPPNKPLVLRNFFELCIPSTEDTAFLPRFAEFCNASCEARLATNSIMRDFDIDAQGNVTADIIVAICVTCEKKIIVPVQLCVLSTGFPQLAAEVSPICTEFPPLFPEQIDETRRDDRKDCSIEAAEETEGKIEEIDDL
ncbi:hypothetical protein [Thermohalobacter berrensis]|uniref:Uncharacterized protein n=1 Tax=Thermohalobacter berrensis TaxID=99594 RepID=A0A419T5H2_9FIRM|nr:hypothetical protein [Thermohalobacter berrensis]RKD32721.1 hypothetical protein BET03_10315 [Thermohalobacter berrensis]